MDASPAAASSRSVRGDEYSRVRVDVAASELTLGAELARGGASVVFAGSFGGARVAIKRPKLRTRADMDRYHKELQLVSSLEHPNVLGIVAARAWPPEYYLIFPLMERGSLAELLHVQRLRPTWQAVLRHGTEIASGLAYLHAAGVVHRDIKPANVLLGTDWVARIADFGLAEHESALRASLQAAIYNDEDYEGRVVRDATGAPLRLPPSSASAPSGGFQREHMVGTLVYTAPEVLFRRVATAAADVFGLGISLCELATRTPPYADRGRNVALAHTVLDLSYNEADLAAAVASEGLRPALPSGEDVPPGLSPLLQACWCAAVDARPSAADVLAALQAAGGTLQGAAPEWLPPPPPPPPPPPAEAIDKLLCGDGDPSLPPAWPVSHEHTPLVSAAALATAGARGVDKMEDRHLVASPLPGAPPHAHLFAVFDGHRGAEAAAFAADSLPRALAAAWGAPGAQTHSSLAKAFVSVDAAFRAVDEARAAGEAPSGAPRRYPGAAALAALIWGDALYIANAGDCRALLCRDGGGAALTRDHTADDDRERDRVAECGAKLARHGPAGTWRVGDAAIAVTRSIGDFDLRDQGLTPEPEICRVELTPDDEFIVLACDGLWDVLSNDEVVDLVESTVKEPGMAAKRLVAEALARGSGDNITCIVAFLRPVSTADTVWTASDAAAVAAAAAGGQ